MTTRLRYAGLLLANIVLAALVVSLFQARGFSESPVEYGTSVLSADSELLTSAFGPHTDGRLMVIFANNQTLQRHPNRISYVNSLAPRVNGERFKIVLATTERLESGRAVEIANLQTYQDRSGKLHRNVHIAPDHPHGGAVIINRKGAVEFRVATIPSEDVIRRLAEKHAFGTIDYRPVSETLVSVFSQGASLPEVSVQPVSPAALRVAAFEDGRTLVLFAASCAPCVLNEYMAELGALKSRFVARGAGHQLAAVFDASFDARGLADQLKDPRMPDLVYRANLRGLVTARHETRTDALAVPLMITIGPEQKVRFAQTLRVY